MCSDSIDSLPETSSSVPVSIRGIKPQDFSQVVKLIRRSIAQSWGEFFPGELIKAWCDKYELPKLKQRTQEMKLWVTKEEMTGDVIGIIGLEKHQDKTFWVRTFYVDPDHQRRGVERELYKTLELAARKVDAEELIVEANSVSKPVY
jgi:GNAT superfamily N-acetyltransferase